jgi:hypothetical protein
MSNRSHVVLKIAPNVFALYGHLHTGSVAVKVGDVEVQINSSGLPRCNHAQRDFVAILASNGQDSCAVRHNGAGNGFSPRRRAARVAAAPTIHHSGWPVSIWIMSEFSFAVSASIAASANKAGSNGRAVGHGIFPRC